MSAASSREPHPPSAWSERRSGRTVIHGTGGATTPAPNRLDQFAPMGPGYVIQTIGVGALDDPLARRRRHGSASARGGRATGWPSRRWARPWPSPARRGRVWSIDEFGRPRAALQPGPHLRQGAGGGAVRRGLQGERDQQRLHGLRQRAPPRLLHVLARHRRPAAAPATHLDRTWAVDRRHHLVERHGLVQRDAAQLEGEVAHLRQPALRHRPGQPPRPRHAGVRRRLRPRDARPPRPPPTARWRGRSPRPATAARRRTSTRSGRTPATCSS